MPSGLTHARTNAALAVGVLIFVQPLEYSFLVASGCVLGIFVGPDLDLNGSSYSFYLVRKYAGYVPYLLWKGFWKPFSYVIPHRHFLSHFPVVSTLFRFIYLFSPLLLIILRFNPDFQEIWWIFPMFWGAVLVDTAHWVMDCLSTKTKKFLRRF